MELPINYQILSRTPICIIKSHLNLFASFYIVSVYCICIIINISSIVNNSPITTEKYIRLFRQRKCFRFLFCILIQINIFSSTIPHFHIYFIKQNCIYYNAPQQKINIDTVSYYLLYFYAILSF